MLGNVCKNVLIGMIYIKGEYKIMYIYKFKALDGENLIALPQQTFKLEYSI